MNLIASRLLAYIVGCCGNLYNLPVTRGLAFIATAPCIRLNSMRL